MTDERPLRVRVAEALGWRDLHLATIGTGKILDGMPDIWWGFPPWSSMSVQGCWPYGEDTPEGWACTGPFVSKYGIELRTWSSSRWQAWIGYGKIDCAFEIGANPCEAVALLIVALAEAGKL